MSQAGRSCRTMNSLVLLFPSPPPFALCPLQHTIFGRVSSGMDVVKRMGNVATDATDRPTTAVKIIRARPA